MNCLLCYGAECEEILMSIEDAENKRLNIAPTLQTHFAFRFQEEPTEGCVCQKCWVKVSVFHEFYLRVECVYRSKDNVFVENIQADIRPQEDSGSDRWDLESLPEATEIVDDPQHAHDASKYMETCFGENKPIVAKNAGCDLLIPLREEVKAHAQEHRPRRGRSCKKTSSEDAEEDLKSQKAVEPQSIPKKRGRPSNGDTSNDSFAKGALRRSDAPAQKQPDAAKKRKSKISICATMKDHRSDETDENATYRNHQVDVALDKNVKHTRRLTKFNTFQCKTCKTYCMTFDALNRHIKLTHNLKAFKCKHRRCVDSFDTQLELDDHAGIMHKRQECQVCKRSIAVRSFHRHMLEIHTKKTQVVCELCGKYSKNRALHIAHMRRYHERLGDYQCDICGHKCKAFVQLKDHIYSRHVHGPQACDICGHISPTRKSLYEHKRTHIPGDKKRFKCDVCGRGFPDKFNLKEHYHIHTGSAGSHHCEFCGKTFRFSSSFSVHKKKMHPQ